MLINAWLYVRQDPVVGDDQANTTFWERIYQYCLEGDNNRTLKQRFWKIRTNVWSFCGYYERHRASEENDDNVLEMTHNLHYKTKKVKFTLVLHWNILHHEPKFLALLESSSEGSKRTKANAPGEYTTSSTGDADSNSQVRPEGIDAAKRKIAKGKSSKGNKAVGTDLGRGGRRFPWSGYWYRELIWRIAQNEGKRVLDQVGRVLPQTGRS
ncbi:glutathione S-transferase T3-like [Punica granatum]|uniref:Glutathione S-transferase T3-like n=1 Tax=Punica granatum TaxID=22663 RepID=A0A6P8DYC5_PUNGR|nr:glutathione S-transferase T3-like [Punica granatum]